MDVKNTIESDQRFGRLGGWLPKKQGNLKNWLGKLKVSAKARNIQLLPVMKEFQDLINQDPIVRKQLAKMIAEVPEKFKDRHDKSYGNVYLESVNEMILLINDVLTTAPEYNETELVGCPINAILDWCMGTTSGNAAFCNYKITGMFKKILGRWNVFLSSSDSQYVIADKFESRHDKSVIKNGWMCDAAKKNLHMEDYIYDPGAKYWGFQSWNDFFTRKLKTGARKIDGENDSSVIVSSCDSKVFKIHPNAECPAVEKQAEFWIKEQPYSLNDMLNNDPMANQFVGGNVYQAFLCAYDYHRWHSPVTGTVIKTEIVDGTYYSEAEIEGYDPGGPDMSQGYITQVATRAIVYIQADDPSIGLMCAVYIGMAEISSCVFENNVFEGARIQKGAPLGYFQFGGSTHCLLFRKEAGVEFNAAPGDYFQMGNKIAVAKGV